MRKFTALVTGLCLTLLLLCPALPCQAAELNAFLTAHEIVTDETGSRLLVYGSKLPENGTLTVSIDKQTLPDARLSTVRQEELPVTVYCLVDISGHLSSQQLQEQKDILNIISSRMGEHDTMVISTVGSKLIEGALLDSLEARKTAISTLKQEGNKADLYSAVVTAMTTLEQKTSYNANRCLLVLSDGILRSGDTTSDQALAAITATTIPVYALGTTAGADSSYHVKNANRVLSLAEASRNGLGLIPAKEDMSAAAAAQEIWEHIQESSVISIDLAQVAATGNNAVVRARYQLEDTCLEDTRTVDLTQVPVTAPTEVPPETEPLVEAIEQPEEPDTSPILIAAIAGGVLLVLVLVLLAVKKGKKRQTVVPVAEEILPTDCIPEEEITQVQECGKTVPADMLNVRLTVAEHKNVAVTFALQPHRQLVLGRDDRADIILSEQDYQLSGRHCMVEWDGNQLYIQDLSSTNGTILNGLALKPNTWNPLPNNAHLHLGSFNYQLTIGK